MIAKTMGPEGKGSTEASVIREVFWVRNFDFVRQWGGGSVAVAPGEPGLYHGGGGACSGPCLKYLPSIP